MHVIQVNLKLVISTYQERAQHVEGDEVWKSHA